MDITYQTDQGKFNYRVCAIMLSKGDSFTLQEGPHTHTFEWLEFSQLKNEYFYPLFLKEAIFHLPDSFTIRTEVE